MQLEFAPYNFWYFLLFFSISLATSIYVLVSYRRNWIIISNAFMFFLCAARFAIEFYFHQIDSYEDLYVINKINGPVSFTLTSIFGLSVFFTIRPFKTSKYEKHLNILSIILLLAIPQAFIWIQNFREKIFFTHPEKINGLWHVGMYDSVFVDCFKLYSLLISAIIFFFLFILSIIRDRDYLIRKVFVMLVFLLFPFVYAQLWDTDNELGLYVPNWGLSFFIEALAIYWFVSGYNIVRNQFEDAQEDISNSISELIVRTDKKYAVLNMNNAASSFFTPPIGNFQNYLSGHIKDQKDQNLLYTIHDKNGSKEITLEINNQTKTLLLRVSPYYWRGKDLGYSFVFTDITELKEKERELAISNNTKDQLFSIISHDLRKPALAFRGITQKVNYLIQKRDFKSLDKLGNSIEQSAIGLNSLLDNLLNWSLTQKDNIRINKQQVKLHDLISDVTTNLSILSKRKQLRIDISQIDQGLLIHTDPDILQTIIRNLLDNAIKYSHEHQSIGIAANTDQDQIMISVKDQGKGMSQDQIEQIYELYQNKSTKGTKGESGSGLGLSLIHELVQRLGGTLTINSQIDQGTKISVRLPKK